ncbi:MAG: hypothetical protein IPJ11_10925 [Gemmatimonadetes bacterium]|nr:hypothetical protein [Gemmatimonadota bacterium]
MKRSVSSGGRLLLAMLCFGVMGLSAQSLACREGPKTSGPETVGRLEPWPALSEELFIGPDARSTLLADGSVVLVDRAKNDLIRIDRTSGRITRLARQGEGPGEIKGVIAVLSGPGDTIAVIDLGNHRIMRWTRSGKPVSSQPYKFLPIPTAHWQLGPELVEVARSLGARGKAEATEMSFRLLRADSTVVLRSLKLPDPPSEIGIFSQTGISAPLGVARIMLATGASPDITVAELRGGQDRIVHLGIGEPVRTNQAMATRLVTLASTQIPEASREATVSGMLQMVPINPTYPLFSRVVAGSGGTIWVQRTFSGTDPGPKDPPVTFSMNDLSGYRWEQFSATGARMAECLMPQDWRVLGVGAGWVLFAKDDADNMRLFTWHPK